MQQICQNLGSVETTVKSSALIPAIGKSELHHCGSQPPSSFQGKTHKSSLIELIKSRKEINAIETRNHVDQSCPAVLV